MKDLIFKIVKRNHIIRFITSHRKSAFFKFLLRWANFYILAYKNISYNSVTNGEMRVVQVLQDHNVSTIIDCGANVGTNLIGYKMVMPDVKVHAVEAIPSTFEKLKENTKSYSNIEYYNFGLGEKKDAFIFKSFPNHDYLSTRYESRDNHESIDVEIPVETGDWLCEKEGIKQVDFLKVDVEGMDFEVIKGFKEKIDREEIDMIQFEYTLNFISSGYFLKDVFDFFADKNYVIGKIYPYEVEFLDYTKDLEDFLDANYIIIRKDKKELINDLKTKKVDLIF